MLFEDDEAAERTARLLEAGAGLNSRASLAENLRNLIGDSSPSGRAVKRRLAEELAAQRNISFKSARDTLRRYEKGARTPAARNAAPIQRSVRSQQTQKALAGQRVRVTVDSTTVYSNPKRPWKGRITVDLSGARKDAFTKALTEGDTNEAARIVFDRYDRDFARAVRVVDVSDINIQPR